MAEQESKVPDIKVNADVKTPITAAVGVSFAIVVFVLSMFVSIGGAILIGVNNANNIKANEKAFEKSQDVLRTREQTAQLRQSIPTCRALIKLDEAKDGATFPHYPGAAAGQGYGEKLAGAITNVVTESKCRTLIKLVDNGVPLTTIIKLQEGSNVK